MVFASSHDGVRGLSWTLADGTGPVERLVEIPGRIQIVSPGTWTPDGRTLVFTYRISAEPRLGLLMRPKEHDRGTWTWKPLTERNIDASSSWLSPDGKWIAYNSDFTGQYEVYVERFPQLTDRQQISIAGGWVPAWSRDGRELYYRRHSDGAMMAVSVETAPVLKIGTTHEMLFESWDGRKGGEAAGGGTGREWDLAPDGRFLMVIPNTGRTTSSTTQKQIVIVENWFEELRQVVPTN